MGYRKMFRIHLMSKRPDMEIQLRWTGTSPTWPPRLSAADLYTAAQRCKTAWMQDYACTIYKLEETTGGDRELVLSAVLSARALSIMCFPQVSGVSAHLKKRAKQAENEKNNYRWDLTRMVS